MRKKNIYLSLTDIKPPKKRISDKKIYTSTFLVNFQKINIRLIIFFFIIVLSSINILGLRFQEQTVGNIVEAYNKFIFNINERNNWSFANLENQSNKNINHLYINVSNFISITRDAPLLLSIIKNINQEISYLLTQKELLKKDALFLITYDGEKLIATIENMRSRLININNLFAEIRNTAVSLGLDLNIIPDYLYVSSNITRQNIAINGLIDLLKNDHYIALFFMDESDMRATGGAINNYALLHINNGQINNIFLRNIHDLNQFINTKYIPPSPLDRYSPYWRAEDLNWFFHFPTSATKLIEAITHSSSYNNYKVSGAIALNHQTVIDILQITGPIELPQYEIIVSAVNFKESNIFAELNIAEDFLSKLILRIGELSLKNRGEIVRIIQNRLNNKDIQLYFTDNRIQNLISDLNWGGEVYEHFTLDFYDYLAIVVSDSKNERNNFDIKQKIQLKSNIDISGMITNTLSINRINIVDDAHLSLNKSINNSYIRALVPRGASLISTEGKFIRPSRSIISINRQNQIQSEYVSLFERGIESNKSVFARWVPVSENNTQVLKMTYQRQSVLSQNFRFVYEKQSGKNSVFSYVIQAPEGYIFEESDSSIYEYTNINPPARLIIDLTLKKYD